MLCDVEITQVLSNYLLLLFLSVMLLLSTHEPLQLFHFLNVLKHVHVTAEIAWYVFFPDVEEQLRDRLGYSGMMWHGKMTVLSFSLFVKWFRSCGKKEDLTFKLTSWALEPNRSTGRMFPDSPSNENTYPLFEPFLSWFSSKYGRRSWHFDNDTLLFYLE